MVNVTQRIKNFFELTQPNVVNLALVGFIGMPTTYFYWLWLKPQSYDNLSIRIIGALLCLPIIFFEYIPITIKKFLPYFSIIALTYNLPFFFTFMLLKNDYSLLWQLCSLLSLFFLMLIVSDWLLVLLIYLAGVLLGLAAYCITTDNLIWPTAWFEIWSIYIFAFVVGSIFNYRAAIIQKERINIMAAVATNIAHELRTPLLSIKSKANGLKNYLPTLLDGYLLAKENHLPVKPLRSAHFEALNQTSDDILIEVDHSNITIDMLLINTNQSFIHQPDNDFFSIKNCVIQAMERYPYQSMDEQEKINCDVDQDFIFFGNPVLIMHVIFNLIKNALYAIKAANKGEIFISIKQSDHFNELHFKDTGQGIPKQQLSSIFNRFATTKKYGVGSGIGLAFCKEVFQQLGGKITASSEENVYTEFVLHFPKVNSNLNNS